MSKGTFDVYDQRCDECLYSGHAIVSPARRAQVLATCRRTDRHFICHKASLRGEEVCCRGFYDADPAATNLMRIAGRLGVVREVPLPQDCPEVESPPSDS